MSKTKGTLVAVGLCLATVLLPVTQAGTITVTNTNDSYTTRAVSAANGSILWQQKNAAGHGFTVLSLWGSAYQMGYAQGTLMYPEIEDAIQQLEDWLGPVLYGIMRDRMSLAIWPTDLENEFDGMLQGIHDANPTSQLDEIDLKVHNGSGDWYLILSCLSHSCWGDFVDGTTRTLSSRRNDIDPASELDYARHHVLIARRPSGNVQTVGWNMAGYVASGTSVNEFGTLASLHNWNDYLDSTHGAYVPRMTMPPNGLTTLVGGLPVNQHLDTVWSEYSTNPIMTGTFFNYYVPEGMGGVLTCRPGEPCHQKRVPQPDFHNGQVLITSNEETDGHSAPVGGEEIDSYYNTGGIKTISDHFAILGNADWARFSVDYRGPRDLSIWADGWNGGKMSSVLKMEFAELTGAICRLGDQSVDDGQSVTVPLSIEPFDDVTGARLTIDYDDRYLEATTVTTTSQGDHFALDHDLSVPGQVSITLTATEASNGTGPVVEITFNTLLPGCSSLVLSQSTLTGGDVIGAYSVDGNVPVRDTVDRDGDGLAESEGDCSDAFAWIYPGANELCNGADDDCDGEVDEGAVCDCRAAPAPRETVFWSMACEGGLPEQDVYPKYMETIHSTSTFSSLTATEEVCAIVAGGSSSACELADGSFMTVLLDIASQRLCDLQPISSSHTAASRVYEAVTEIDALLSDSARTNADCDTARAIADDMSSGQAIPDFLSEELELAASKEASGTSLSWTASDAFAAGRPTTYRVYRSRGLPLSWELLGENCCQHWFPDPEPPPVGLSDFYRVVPAPAFRQD